MKFPRILPVFVVVALVSTVAIAASSSDPKAEKAPIPAVPEVIKKADPHTEHQLHEAMQGPSTKEYKEASGKMHSRMIIPYTGDSDVDFVKGMIPHHQGAVEMAQVLLKYGKDPEIKALAQSIIDAQNKEIAQMEAWLKKHSPKEDPKKVQ